MLRTLSWPVSVSRTADINLSLLTSPDPLVFQEVCSQIWATLYDYPGLKSCDGLIRYIKECVRTAWALTNQVRQSVCR